MSDKPDCYKCKWRGTVPGDRHSCCRHAEAKKLGGNNMLLGMLAIMKRGGGPLPNTIGVIGAEHGIRSGWFNWPFNFDPAWLEACNGFKEKK